MRDVIDIHEFSKIRDYGPYIRSLDLTTDVTYDKDLLELIGDCCNNVESVMLSFQGLPDSGLIQPDYPTLFKKWSSVSDKGNNTISHITAKMKMDSGKGGVFNFEDFNKIQEHLTEIGILETKADNPVDYYTDEYPILHKLLSWDTFRGFFQSFPKLISIHMNGVYVKLVSVYDGDNSDNICSDSESGKQGEEISEALPSLIESNLVNLTVISTVIEEADFGSLHELLIIAPALDYLDYLVSRRLLNNGPLKYREAHLNALRPFGDRHWAKLDLGYSDKFQGRELGEFLKSGSSFLNDPFFFSSLNEYN
ncbi:hypothetical protein BGX27_009281 [Mortierella sp. AM989]|nr:hypothetical protein BGX27_009281 [Mortierella sp. AM989]